MVKYDLLPLFKLFIGMDPVLGEFSQICGDRSQMNMDLSLNFTRKYRGAHLTGNYDDNYTCTQY